jgi:hypothetical protein
LHYYGEFARKEDMLVEIDASLGMGVRNGKFIMDQRLSFNGQATLKYRHSQDRVPVLEGEDYFWGTFTAERNINSTSIHYNSTDIDPDMMPCCLDPQDLREYNLMTSAEVRKWIDSK